VRLARAQRRGSATTLFPLCLEGAGLRKRSRVPTKYDNNFLWKEWNVPYFSTIWWASYDLSNVGECEEE